MELKLPFHQTSACIPYWPQNEGASIEVGDFTITKHFGSENSSYTTTTLKLTHGPTRYTTVASNLS